MLLTRSDEEQEGPEDPPQAPNAAENESAAQEQVHAIPSDETPRPGAL